MCSSTYLDRPFSLHTHSYIRYVCLSPTWQFHFNSTVTLVCAASKYASLFRLTHFTSYPPF